LQNGGKYKSGNINFFYVATNCFFQYMGWKNSKVKTIRVQKKAFIPDNKNLSKEEYRKMVAVAEKSSLQ